MGIVLTGMLDDGALGLRSIKLEGGTAVVQDPAEAMFPSMPTNAMNTVDVDFVLRTSEISKKIQRVVREPWLRVETSRGKDSGRRIRSRGGNQKTDEIA